MLCKASVLMLWLIMPISASQLFIYDSTAVHGFIRASCNLTATFGDAHWYSLSAGQVQEPAHPGGKLRCGICPLPLHTDTAWQAHHDNYDYCKAMINKCREETWAEESSLCRVSMSGARAVKSWTLLSCPGAELTSVCSLSTLDDSESVLLPRRLLTSCSFSINCITYHIKHFLVIPLHDKTPWGHYIVQS